MKSKVELIVSN